jgi:hypothetical protein
MHVGTIGDRGMRAAFPHFRTPVAGRHGMLRDLTQSGVS